MAKVATELRMSLTRSVQLRTTSLLTSGKHLGVESELAQVEAPSFWHVQEPQISHVSSFKKEAIVYKAYLNLFGINLVAHEDIEPTKMLLQ